MFGIRLAYYGSELGSSDCSTYGNAYGKFEGLLLRVRLVSIVGIEFGRVLGTTLGVLDRLLLGKYVGIELGYSEWSTDGTKYENVDGLLIGSWIVSIDILDIGNNKGEKLGFPNV